MVCSQAIVQNFTIWYDSVHDSIANESKCGGGGGGGGGGHFPSKPAASSACGFAAGMAMNGNDFAAGHVAGVLSEAYLTCLSPLSFMVPNSVFTGQNIDVCGNRNKPWCWIAS